MNAAVSLAGGVVNSFVQLRDNKTMPILGLGVYCTEPGQATEDAVVAALGTGYRLVDTAACYGNEESVGRAIRRSGLRRDEIFVVTKLWHSDHGQERTYNALTTSLQKLGLEYVDLYLIHCLIGGKLLETWDAMLDLRDRELARSVGVSNCGIHHLEGIRQAGREAPAVNQFEVHPFLQQREVVQYCEQWGITVMAYSPLARAQKMSDPVLARIMKKYSKTPAQVMLRWCLQRGHVAIPKSVSVGRIVENAEIFDFELSAEDVDEISRLECNYRTCWNAIEEPWQEC